MSLLICVKSCIRDVNAGLNAAIRETWLKDVRDSHHRFFVGQGGAATLASDETKLDVADDYDSLPYKTKAILEWGLASQDHYDHFFLCDTDTYLIPSDFFACDFKHYDYTGRFGRPIGEKLKDFVDDRGYPLSIWPYASGGIGYFLSRRAAKLVVSTEPTHWAEDLWVGQVLGPLTASGDIKCLDIVHFDGVYAFHYCATGKRVPYSTSWMKSAYINKRPW